MRAWPRALTAASLLAASGCAELPDAFLCREAADCVDGELSGACEPTGYCSFEDTTCASGRRYGSYAREDLAGACVTSSQRIDSFTLIDAALDLPVAGAEELRGQIRACIGATGCPEGFARVGAALSVRANTVPTEVGSVKFWVDGIAGAVENTAPYAVGSELNGDYKAWTPGEGVHDLMARPFAEEMAVGTPGASATIEVEILVP